MLISRGKKICILSEALTFNYDNDFLLSFVFNLLIIFSTDVFFLQNVNKSEIFLSIFLRGQRDICLVNLKALFSQKSSVCISMCVFV